MKRDSDALDRIIAANQLIPVMSNAKWIKLLQLFVENASLINECRVKLIWEQEATERQLVFDENTSYNFDYYDTAMEAMITGKPRGWYAYKEIEWLDFPGFLSNGETAQDVEAIQRKIESLGKFQLSMEKGNLRLYAYQRS